MTGDAPFEGTRMMEEFLSDDVSAQRAARAVSQPLNNLADYWGGLDAPRRGLHQRGKSHSQPSAKTLFFLS